MPRRQVVISHIRRKILEYRLWRQGDRWISILFYVDIFVGAPLLLYEQLPPILQLLGVKPENWINSVSRFQKYFFDATCTLSLLEQFREEETSCVQVSRCSRAHRMD